VAGDHAVAEDLLLLHAEVGAAVGHEAVELDEAVPVEQRRDALARGELAGFVLLVDAGLAAAEDGLPLELFQAGEGVGHGDPLARRREPRPRVYYSRSAPAPGRLRYARDVVASVCPCAVRPLARGPACRG
jgi:hypothetical protein